MKQLVLVVALLPALAFAGKREREYWKEKVAPAIEAAQTAFKKSCGADLKVTVDEKLNTDEDLMSNARYVCESVRDGVAGYCTDDASKKAMQKMKSLTVTSTDKSNTSFTFSGSKGVANVNKQSYVSWDMMTAEIDK